jgi:hypothetical protein
MSRRTKEGAAVTTVKLEATRRAKQIRVKIELRVGMLRAEVMLCYVLRGFYRCKSVWSSLVSSESPAIRQVGKTSFCEYQTRSGDGE